MELLPIFKGAATYVPGLYRPERGSTGGSDAARYCYSVWLRHLTLLASCGLPTSYEVVAELGPGDSLGISTAALLTGTASIDALDVVRYASHSSNEVVLDELVQLLRRREPIPDAQELPAVHPRLNGYEFPGFLSESRLAAALAPERVERIRASLKAECADPLIRYHVPWQRRWPPERGGADLVFSQAVLEHVVDLEGTHASVAAGVKLGGVVSHVIDFRCHKLARNWDGHLQYGERLWRLVKGRRPYLLNRRAPSDHLKAMEEAGFQIVRALRVELPPTVPRQRLPTPFSQWTDLDRTTTTMVVVARRVR